MHTGNTSIPSSPIPRLGRRERSKLERRRRIEQAARAVFEEKGFAAATTREIAELADVAPATLFAYATEKRELLLMLFRDDLWRLTETAAATLPAGAGLDAQLEHMFRPRYAFWVRHPGLSRQVVRELANDAGSTRAKPLAAEGIRNAFLDLRERICQLIREHQDAGAVEAGIDPAVAARLIMHVYFCEHNAWLDGPTPSVDAGVATLMNHLAVLMRGIAPRE